MRTLVIEVTSLLATHGYTSGIPRVAFSFVRNLFSQSEVLDKLKFIAHNNVENRYDGVSHARIAEKLSALGYETTLKFFAEEGSERHGCLDDHFPAESSYTFFSLGAFWHDPLLCQNLFRIKQRRDLRCCFVFYDFIPTLFPHTYQAGFSPNFTRSSIDALWCADSAICISENTRRDLHKLCAENAIPHPDSHVVRLGDDLSRCLIEETPPRPTNLPQRLDKEPFTLCVGTLEIRKNQILLYQTWRRMIENQERTDESGNIPLLVIVGRKGWQSELFLEFAKRDPLISKFILILQDCSDDDISWLYRNCLFFLYPSIYEGWGLPVCEGLAYGKFGIVSNSSSIPEVGTRFVDYHDPFDPVELEEKIKALLHRPEMLAEKERIIAEDYQTTRWSTCSENMLKILIAT